jgi:hypothetical protein
MPSEQYFLAEGEVALIRPDNVSAHQALAFFLSEQEIGKASVVFSEHFPTYNFSKEVSKISSRRQYFRRVVSHALWPHKASKKIDLGASNRAAYKRGARAFADAVHQTAVQASAFIRYHIELASLRVCIVSNCYVSFRDGVTTSDKQFADAQAVYRASSRSVTKVAGRRARLDVPLITGMSIRRCCHIVYYLTDPFGRGCFFT